MNIYVKLETLTRLERLRVKSYIFF